MTTEHPLPPGQRRVERLPRFGTHLHRPPPEAPPTPVVAVRGAVEAPFELGVDQLGSVGRTSLTADFHCVAGWSVTGLRWEGVPFGAFYREVVAPRVPDGVEVTHLVLEGLDGYRCVVTLEDALGDDVLLADGLDGRPLTAEEGGPLRFVSPSQYGWVSAKHVCAVELHTSEPDENFGAASGLARRLMVRPLFARHPRSRVWQEERNGLLPAWAVRPVYRVLTPPIAWLSSRGRRS